MKLWKKTVRLIFAFKKRPSGAFPLLINNLADIVYLN